ARRRLRAKLVKYTARTRRGEAFYLPAALLSGLKRAAGDRRLLLPTLALLVDVAAVDPGLDADDAIRGLRLGKAVVDVRTQRVQRQATLQVPLRARNFIAVQAARDTDLDALAAKAQRRIHRLAHRAAERDALFQLQRDVLSNQLSIELRLVDLENVNEDFPIGPLLNVGLQLVDLRALAADDDTRTRGADNQPQLVARTLDLNRRDAGSLQLVAELSLQLHILDQQLVIAALHEPARLPRLVHAEAESIRMDFLSHKLPSSLMP